MTNVIGISSSPFTLQQEVYDWGADMWTVKLTWNRIVSSAKAEPLLAVIAALRGPLGTLLVGDPLRATPRGSAGGSPVVNGTVAVGARQLTIRGASATITGWLKAGDNIQVGSGATTRLYKALTDINTDGSGHATVDIWPSIREGYSDGTAITLSSPKGTFRLSSNAKGWQESNGIVYAAELDLMEAI